MQNFIIDDLFFNDLYMACARSTYICKQCIILVTCNLFLVLERHLGIIYFKECKNVELVKYCCIKTSQRNVKQLVTYWTSSQTESRTKVNIILDTSKRFKLQILHPEEYSLATRKNILVVVGPGVNGCWGQRMNL